MPTHFLTIIFFVFFINTIHAQEIIIEDPTKNKGKVEWQWRANVGNIPQNIPVTATFKIKNISNEPLQLLEVKATCKCTVVDFSSEPIPSGKFGFIKAEYDAKAEGGFNKMIIVTTNFDAEHPVALSLEGNVVKKLKNKPKERPRN